MRVLERLRTRSSSSREFLGFGRRRRSLEFGDEVHDSYSFPESGYTDFVLENILVKFEEYITADLLFDKFVTSSLI